MIQHTELPWKFDIDEVKYAVIFNNDGAIVLRDGDYLMDGDAEFIVRACNSHHDLLEALEELQRGIYSFGDIPLEVKNFVYVTCRDAITKATLGPQQRASLREED